MKWAWNMLWRCTCPPHATNSPHHNISMSPIHVKKSTIDPSQKGHYCSLDGLQFRFWNKRLKVPTISPHSSRFSHTTMRCIFLGIKDRYYYTCNSNFLLLQWKLIPLPLIRWVGTTYIVKILWQKDDVFNWWISSLSSRILGKNMGDLCYSGANVSIWDVRFQDVHVLLIPNAYELDTLAEGGCYKAWRRSSFVK